MHLLLSYPQLLFLEFVTNTMLKLWEIMRSEFRCVCVCVWIDIFLGPFYSFVVGFLLYLAEI